MNNSLVFLTFFTFVLAGCSQPMSKSTDANPAAIVESKISTTTTKIPSQTAVITPVEKLTSTSTVNAFKETAIYSPLIGIPLAQLTDMIFNPFHLPAPGSDDPHQGIDFSDIDPETKIAKTGLGVQAIIEGRVIAAISDRFPYGNAVMTETDWQDLPPGWQALIDLQAVPAPWKKISALSCPTGWDQYSPDLGKSSLYILYAHLLDQPELEIGERIIAGDPIGNIGMSGNALAPHVHVEIRYGPSNLFPDGIAHYDVSASAAEMSNYCRWRISGWFRPIDPMLLLLNQ